MKRTLMSAALPMALLFGGLAHGKGPGIRTGDFVLHPGAFVAAGWDDNVFYDNSDEFLSPRNGAAVFKFGGDLQLENRNPSRLKLELGTGIKFRIFSASETQGEQPGAQSAISERNGVESGSLDGKLTLFPKRAVAFRLEESLRFSDTPAYEVSVVGFEKLDNSVGGDIIFQPGSNPNARALTMSLGYRLHTITFFDASQVGAQRAEMLSHEARLLTRLQLLPKTALLLDVQWAFSDYGEGDPRVDPNTLETVNDPSRDAKPLYLRLGLQGLITRRLSLNVRGGYANTFNVEGSSYSGFVGLLELQYKLEPSLAFTLGGEWDATGSNFSNFVVRKGVYTSLNLAFQQAYINTRVGYDIYDYSDSGRPVTSPSREDPLLRAKAELGYNIRTWARASVSWSYENNSTDFKSPSDEALAVIRQTSPGAQQDLAAYTRQLIMLQVEADY